MVWKYVSLHAWNIDLATGEPLGADAGKGCTPVVPLQVRDGRSEFTNPLRVRQGGSWPAAGRVPRDRSRTRLSRPMSE